MLSLNRFGKITNDDNPNSYGIVDELSFTYNGNQLKTISDRGAVVDINESADFNSYAPQDADTHYSFNLNGAMTQDLNKGITNIEYNSLNLPISMDISNERHFARNEYLYSASGVKLQVKHSWNKDDTSASPLGSGIISNELDTTKVIDYVGNKIYENGELKKILVDGGYYDYEKREYFFYIQDHLGNNRVVVNQNDSVVQRSDYYPFGMEFADNSGNDQPYKYNGKELDKMHGLNMYDYSARYVDPAYGRFTTIDPLAEKYYSISPYAYVANNPINATDPRGDTIRVVIDGVNYDYGQDKKGNYGFIGADGTLYSGDNIFVNKLTSALSTLRGTEKGLSMINELQGSTNLFTIESRSTINKLGLADGNGFRPKNWMDAGANLAEVQSVTGNTKGSKGSGGTIYWNPVSMDGGVDINGETSRPPAIGLVHEIGHATDANKGLLHHSEDLTNPITGATYYASHNGLLRSEWSATTAENIVRGQISPVVPARAYYGYVLDLDTGIPIPTGPRLLP